MQNFSSYNHLSNIILISKTNHNSISIKTKVNFVIANGNPSKVTHMKLCSMCNLTKKTDDYLNEYILEEHIKAVSQYNNNKSEYQRYLS